MDIHAGAATFYVQRGQVNILVGRPGGGPAEQLRASSLRMLMQPWLMGMPKLLCQ